MMWQELGLVINKKTNTDKSSKGSIKKETHYVVGASGALVDLNSSGNIWGQASPDKALDSVHSLIFLLVS